MYQGIDFDAVQDRLTEEGITFYFNTPKAPHKVGIVESIVKICKNILKRKLSRARLTTRSFMNLSIEVEHIINCRPITTVTADNHERIICPIELATGKSSSILPDYKTDKNYQIKTLNTKADVIKHLKYQDMLRKQIINQFYNDYILTLQTYQTKTCKSRPLKISDLVILNDSKLMHNGRYAIGSVINLTKSRGENRERTATIKLPATKTYKEKILTRDVRYLARLECDSLESD